MAMIGGLAATNFGRAIFETADALDRERQFQQARADRRSELDARLDAKLEEIMLRYGLTGGPQSRRSGGRGGGAPEYTDEERAAMAGLDVPSFQRAQRVNQTGGEQEIKTTADDPGMAYASEEDRQSIAGRGLIGDTMETIAGKRDAPRYRRGIVHAAMDPADIENFEKGQVIAETRDLAFSEDPQNVERARRAQLAMGGKPRFNVDENEKIDEMGGGFMGPTDVGRSMIEENRAQAVRAKAEADEAQRGGGKALRDAIQTVDAQRKTLQGERTNLRMQRDSELRNATGRAAKQRITEDYAKRERELDKRLEDLDRQYDELRRMQSLPSRQGAAGQKAPYPDGTRLRGKDGRIYVVRGGVPVPEGQ